MCERRSLLCLASVDIKTIRDKWGFDGYFVSDCGALCDIVKKHKIECNPFRGAALALNAGCDLECGKLHRMLSLSYICGYVKKSTLHKVRAD